MTEPAKQHNVIRAFALVCVAITTGYVMWMGYRLNETLSGPGWCGRAIGADKAAEGSKIDVAQSCVGLLTIQLRSIATNSHILFGVIALCLAVLMVIVVAGGKLSFRGNREGVEANIGKDDVLPVQVVNPPSAPVPVEPTKGA